MLNRIWLHPPNAQPRLMSTSGAGVMCPDDGDDNDDYNDDDWKVVFHRKSSHVHEFSMILQRVRINHSKTRQVLN